MSDKPIMIISSAQGPRASVDRDRYEDALKVLIANGFRTIRPARSTKE